MRGLVWLLLGAVALVACSDAEPPTRRAGRVNGGATVSEAPLQLGDLPPGWSEGATIAAGGLPPNGCGIPRDALDGHTPTAFQGPEGQVVAVVSGTSEEEFLELVTAVGECNEFSVTDPSGEPIADAAGSPLDLPGLPAGSASGARVFTEASVGGPAFSLGAVQVGDREALVLLGLLPVDDAPTMAGLLKVVYDRLDS